MFDVGHDQAAGLRAEPPSAGAALMPVASPAQPARAYELLCQLAMSLRAAGRLPVIVVRGADGVLRDGSLVVGSLKFGYLARLELSEPFGGRVVRETAHLQDLKERVRDVRQGPDGWLYMLTDASRGRLLRVLPR